MEAEKDELREEMEQAKLEDNVAEAVARRPLGPPAPPLSVPGSGGGRGTRGGWDPGHDRVYNPVVQEPVHLCTVLA